MFCNNKYEEVKTYEFKSQFEQARPSQCNHYLAMELSRRGIISVVKCNKCGKIKHIKTEF